jgi:hypothetical protein
MALGTRLGVCDDLLSLLAGPGQDLVGLTLCVSDRPIRSLLCEYQMTHRSPTGVTQVRHRSGCR